MTSSPRSELFERASDLGSATSSPRNELFERLSDTGSPSRKKEFGPRAPSSHLPTQDDLVRVAMDQKRASRRLKRGIMRRAAAMTTTPKPEVLEPEYDFAFLFDEEEKGDVVVGLLQ